MELSSRAAAVPDTSPASLAIVGPACFVRSEPRVEMRRPQRIK